MYSAKRVDFTILQIYPSASVALMWNWGVKLSCEETTGLVAKGSQVQIQNQGSLSLPSEFSWGTPTSYLGSAVMPSKEDQNRNKKCPTLQNEKSDDNIGSPPL